jgi:hypothetical protein
MDSPAPVTLPEQTQIEDGPRSSRGLLHSFGFHVLAILLGIALAFM